MPFARPSPQEIRDRIGGDVVRLLGSAGAIVRRSLEYVLVRIVAVASHELHGHLAWTARQILVDQADDEELDRHAGIWGIERFPASRAHGRVVFTGAPGVQVAGLTELRRGDDRRFFVDVTGVIDADGTLVRTVTAAEDGSAGNTPVGTALSLVAPIAGVQSAVRVVEEGGTGIRDGAEAETDASLRRRVITRIQKPPHGGAAHDYPGWVGEVVGDTRAWVWPGQLGRGTVLVSFIMPDGSIPSDNIVEDVQAHIDRERPVTAAVTVIAPIVEPLDFTIRLTPDTANVRTAVVAELADMIASEAIPGGTLSFSRVSAAISNAAGEHSHVLIAPTADVTVPFGRISRLGTVTWIV